VAFNQTIEMAPEYELDEVSYTSIGHIALYIIGGLVWVGVLISIFLPSEF